MILDAARSTFSTYFNPESEVAHIGKARLS
jgi:hypothetical protein